MRAYQTSTPNLPTKIVDFRGLDSSTILTLRGGILRPIGDFPEVLTRAMLAGAMLVGGFGRSVRQVVPPNRGSRRDARAPHYKLHVYTQYNVMLQYIQYKYLQYTHYELHYNAIPHVYCIYIYIYIQKPRSVKIFRGPLLRGPLIISSYVLIVQPHSAECFHA